ncbi:acetyl-CoA carboxylase biotin carboxyl carrier protein [Lacticaseibacillus saniviri]|uniref:Biotin carboxyl carrier protein of acetyl-CoA carboxylase n=1 Tax=Lacticaseibacillus saniviri JCM 17471 = DSM 24301 TaxID=1293598 RepID=A0A0R2MS75_9LACO|nr:biotin/lipoyl-containing protein [Lacticaseibacillus saniviri]KRO16430.1 hypothetical protein IV56_GL001212 [Lacticaseibacillus saniviri JCM 17471 = DSM 24301]MCG4282541.1 acetyl-CoA carboxylase biotin carboxyl carrier protein subunit [Lacticaseibacillus saniviri]
MDEATVIAIMQQFAQSSLTELDYAHGADRLRLKQAGTPAPVTETSTNVIEANTPEPVTTTDYQVKAPLVGITYLSPKPGEPAYKQVGDTVAVGDTLCIIESMKMMNEIKSERAGIVSAILVDNEALVEFDQPLFAIKETS